ncbi:MAG: sensor histidine kinase [bacterium]
MNAPNIHPIAKDFLDSRNKQFWLFQVFGWLGITVLNHFSLTLWYNQPELKYVAHNILQSLLGILISWPMRPIFRSLWDSPPFKRFSLVFCSVLLLAMLWSVLRLPLFMVLTGEEDLWPDFGGWLFPSFFIFGCWAALYHGIKYYQLLQQEHQTLLEITAEQQRERLKRSEAESQAREAQLRLLRYQLNPHFLFNTLNSMSSLVSSGQNGRAQQMINQLSHFLRYSLASDRSLVANLSMEIEALRQYLLIEQARFGERLRIEFDIDEQSREASLPSMLLQPLVENALKYAIAPSENGGTIRIASRVEGDRLMLTVEDSGAEAEGSGVEAEGYEVKDPDAVKIQEGTGVGLRNIRERLEVYCGNQFAMESTESSLGGLKIALTLPLEKTDPAQSP